MLILNIKRTFKVEEFEKNEAFIKNLPYDYTWWFRVSIFDQMSGKWSKFSAPSKPLKVGLGESLKLKLF